MRVLRVYHGGRDPGHRARERALVRAGLDVTLVVPSSWPDAGSEQHLSAEPFPIVEVPVRRRGDVNRHAYIDQQALRRVLEDVRPDILDVHEEPFSLAARQWLAAAPASLPAVMYTAQNIDKRFPPPFTAYERQAFARLSGVYPCSRQAAAVVRGKGFAGLVEVVPLGYDDAVYTPGRQSPADDELVLGLVGRLVAEKGVADAVDVLAAVNRVRPARLLVVGTGPEGIAARQRAADRGVLDRFELDPWRSPAEMAALYRGMHVLLIPSRATPSWTEQFGRVIVEAQASGAIVVGYTSGAIPEVAGEPALLAPEGDAAALAAALDVLTDPQEHERRRAAGLELAAERTWARVAERQAAFYRRAVESGGGGFPVPRSASARRAAARAEFGPTALTPAGSRPFALPVLRRGGPLAALLAATLDAATRAAELLSGRR